MLRGSVVPNRKADHKAIRPTRFVKLGFCRSVATERTSKRDREALIGDRHSLHIITRFQTLRMGMIDRPGSVQQRLSTATRHSVALSQRMHISTRA